MGYFSAIQKRELLNPAEYGLILNKLFQVKEGRPKPPITIILFLKSKFIRPNNRPMIAII